MQFSQSELHHYNRHLILDEIGEAGQAKLKAAKCLVVGAGGLGCPVLQYLTSAGIGEIGIVDFDVVDLSNLQRQVLFSYDDEGKNKANTAKEKLGRLNPHITIKAYPEKLSTENALEIFSHYDIIVDGTDNFSTRYLINDAAVILKKPFVHGSIYKFEGQVSLFNLNDGPTYRCLFPKVPEAGTVPSCSEIGVLGVLPGIIGSYMANEVIKYITQIGNLLCGEVLTLNMLNNSSYKITLNKDDSNWGNVPKNKEEFKNFEYEEVCEVNMEIEITADEFKEKTDAGIKVIDVREPFEMPRLTKFDVIEMPLSNFLESLHLLDKNEEYIIVCQHGVRSMNALRYLKEKEGFKNLTSLSGGVASL